MVAINKMATSSSLGCLWLPLTSYFWTCLEFQQNVEFHLFAFCNIFSFPFQPEPHTISHSVIYFSLLSTRQSLTATHFLTLSLSKSHFLLISFYIQLLFCFVVSHIISHILWFDRTPFVSSFPLMSFSVFSLFFLSPYCLSFSFLLQTFLPFLYLCPFSLQTKHFFSLSTSLFLYLILTNFLTLKLFILFSI